MSSKGPVGSRGPAVAIKGPSTGTSKGPSTSQSKGPSTSPSKVPSTSPSKVPSTSAGKGLSASTEKSLPISTGKVTLPYSFMVKCLEPVDDKFLAAFKGSIKAMCKKYPKAPTGEALAGVTLEFDRIFKGFGGQFHPDVVAEMKKEKRVQVAPDAVLDLFAYGPLVDRDTPSWALAEISRDLSEPFDPTKLQQFKYHGSALGGEGITIWTLDGGCNNVIGELDAPRVTQEPWSAGSVVARNSAEEFLDLFSRGQKHGTNIAATAGGTKHGPAPLAKIRAIQLADQDGYYPTAMKTCGALEYIEKNEASPHLSVVNCSGGLPAKPGDFTRDSVREGFERLAKKGFIIVAAAGNSNQEIIPPTPNNQINDSVNPKIIYPGSLDSVITVGALDKTRSRAGFSNYGTPVDIWAPGTEIPSVGDFVDGKVTQGTSLSAPIVSGIIACILAEKHRDDPTHQMTMAEVKKQLEEWALTNMNPQPQLHNGRPLVIQLQHVGIGAPKI